MPPSGIVTVHQREVLSPISINGGLGAPQSRQKGLSVFEHRNQGIPGNIFGHGTQNKENVSRENGQRGSGYGQDRWGDMENRARETLASRVVVKASQSKNRKKKAVEREDMEENGRPVKLVNVGELSDLIQVPVEAATQPHRSL